MEFSEKVLVLRVGTFREADCWVRFFSPTHGLLTAFAFGGRRSRKRFCGCLDQLSLVHFRVSQGRQEYLCLQEGTLINGFELIEGSSCVDPKNYDEELGTKICVIRMRNEVWKLLGFVLQWAKKGIKPEENRLEL